MSGISARHMLKCLACITAVLDAEDKARMALIPKVMGKMLLCLKDSNAKTREAAYQLLLAMSIAKDDMTDYFNIMLAALGAKTTHMRSAAMMALSSLVFEQQGRTQRCRGYCRRGCRPWQSYSMIPRGMWKRE